MTHSRTLRRESESGLDTVQRKRKKTSRNDLNWDNSGTHIVNSVRLMVAMQHFIPVLNFSPLYRSEYRIRQTIETPGGIEGPYPTDRFNYMRRIFFNVTKKVLMNIAHGFLIYDNFAHGFFYEKVICTWLPHLLKSCAGFFP